MDRVVTRLFLTGPRGCGKTTIAETIATLLPEWKAVDLDVLFRAMNRSADNSWATVDTEEYYRKSHDILLEQTEREKVVVALGGGTLINRLHPGGCIEALTACKTKGELVLLLPSRFDWRSRSILLKREKKRNYKVMKSMKKKSLKQIVRENYDDRVPFFRDNADLVVFGTHPEKVAQTIIGTYQLT